MALRMDLFGMVEGNRCAARRALQTAFVEAMSPRRARQRQEVCDFHDGTLFAWLEREQDALAPVVAEGGKDLRDARPFGRQSVTKAVGFHGHMISLFVTNGNDRSSTHRAGCLPASSHKGRRQLQLHPLAHDAVTSSRPYQAGWDPAESSWKVTEWSKGPVDERGFKSR